MAANDFSVSGKSNECSCASARSNSFCACGLHEVLNSTLPKLSFLACASSSASAADVVNAKSDRTASSLGFIGPSLRLWSPPRRPNQSTLRRGETRPAPPADAKPLEIQAANRHHADRG